MALPQGKVYGSSPSWIYKIQNKTNSQKVPTLLEASRCFHMGGPTYEEFNPFTHTTSELALIRIRQSNHYSSNLITIQSHKALKPWNLRSTII